MGLFKETTRSTFKFLPATSNNYASRVLAGCLLKLKIMQETLLFFSFPFLFCFVCFNFNLFKNSRIYCMCHHESSLKTLFNKESGFRSLIKTFCRTVELV